VQLKLAFDSPEQTVLAQAEPFDPPEQPSLAQADVRVTFVRHRRARRYVLRMLPDGTFRVTMPRRGTLKEAHAFVTASARWIAKQRARRDTRGPAESPSPLRPIVEHWFRKKAERELPARLMVLAREHDIQVTAISVRDQRSRWGACSSKGRITLNWRLIQTPDFVRDYVLLHELMHRRELNHSRRFWRLVAACCPRHVEAREWLKREGKRLWSDHV
jgi:predicted metal-dependent hydrolase